MIVRGFGRLKDGRYAGLYVLRNDNGMEAHFTDYGASIVRLIMPDKSGKLTDVVLGYDSVRGYERGRLHAGGVVGRYANRIAGAQFRLPACDSEPAPDEAEAGGRVWQLTPNDGPNCLHGGRDYYDKRLWEANIPFISGRHLPSGDVFGDVQLTFRLDSPDGDQGFPGNMHIEVTYSLTDDNELHIDYKAASDHDTPVSLTNHAYFNLNGHDSGEITNHLLQIEAEWFTPIDQRTLPTGELTDVTGTPMDFRRPKEIGRDISSNYLQLALAQGYDHNYVLTEPADYLRDIHFTETTASGKYEAGANQYSRSSDEDGGEIAFLYSRSSGIRMSVMTDMPGMQLYSGNFISGELGKDGAIYDRRGGVCLETQFWPDTPNQESFPGGILKAGEEFHSRTTYRFEW